MERTKSFGISILRLSNSINVSHANLILIRQLVRAGTAIGANYRSALRARSKKEFISKLKIAAEEADETCYWLELIIELGIFPKEIMTLLLKEGQEITAILTTAGKTAKERLI